MKGMRLLAVSLLVGFLASGFVGCADNEPETKTVGVSEIEGYIQEASYKAEDDKTSPSFINTIASEIGIAVSVPNSGPSPDVPTPNNGECPECNGRGWNGDGVTRIPCTFCGGDGKLETQDWEVLAAKYGIESPERIRELFQADRDREAKERADKSEGAEPKPDPAESGQAFPERSEGVPFVSEPPKKAAEPGSTYTAEPVVKERYREPEEPMVTKMAGDSPAHPFHYCWNCKKEVGGNDAYCSNCGAKTPADPDGGRVYRGTAGSSGKSPGCNCANCNCDPCLCKPGEARSDGVPHFYYNGRWHACLMLPQQIPLKATAPAMNCVDGVCTVPYSSSQRAYQPLPLNYYNPVYSSAQGSCAGGNCSVGYSNGNYSGGGRRGLFGRRR